MTQVSEADEPQRAANSDVMPIYPAQYGQNNAIPEVSADSNVASHRHIPEALQHAFATFGTLMSASSSAPLRQDGDGPHQPRSRRGWEDLTGIPELPERREPRGVEAIAKKKGRTRSVG